MTREEAKNIIHAIVCAYPNYKPENLTETVNIWAAMLKDYDYGQISIALKAYILSDTKGYAPSVGQIIDLLVPKDDTTELEAWAMVRKAIKNGTYGAQEEFAKLPPLIQRAVGGASQLTSWAQMPSETVQSVAQSNFLRSYRAVKERDRADAKMPMELKELLKSATDKMIGQEDENGIERKIEGLEDAKKRFLQIAEEL